MTFSMAQSDLAGVADVLNPGIVRLYRGLVCLQRRLDLALVGSNLTGSDLTMEQRDREYG